MTELLLEQEYTFIKGKIAVVIMTFDNDSGCLTHCIRCLEEQKKKGYNLELFLLDDATNALQQPYQYTSCHYRKTYF